MACATLPRPDLKVSFAGKVPEVTGQIVVQTLYLDDFLPQLVASQTTEAKDIVENSNSIENPDGKNLHNGPLFSQQPFSLLGRLHDLDCEIDITIDKVIGFQELLRDFELGVKIKNDMLSIDPVTFVFDGGYVRASLSMDDLEGVPDISCGVLGLKADKGVLECRTFILEAPSLRITGAGTVDLTTETCDLTLYPKKKKKFWATVTPVTIKGPLRNPTVRTIPVKMVAILYGGSLLAPHFFLPAIGLNYLWEMVSKDKNGVQSPCFANLSQQSQ